MVHPHSCRFSRSDSSKREALAFAKKRRQVTAPQRGGRSSARQKRSDPEKGRPSAGSVLRAEALWACHGVAREDGEEVHTTRKPMLWTFCHWR